MDGAAYAALAGNVAPHKPSGPLKPTAKGSDSSEPTPLFEAQTRRMSTNMSWPGRMFPLVSDGTTRQFSLQASRTQANFQRGCV